MHQTIIFAKQELNRYIAAITGCAGHCIELRQSEPADSPYSDHYAIRVESGKGEISGCNPRSVLLGVYRFLFLIGCRFIAPGQGGEILPAKKLSDCHAQEERTVPIRHRGICIEGAVSRENVLDMIDWLPKVGFNSYFIQFREGHTFFERWYTHQGNNLLEALPYNIEESRRFVREAEAEIEKRSLIYHKVGHGWTCECIGYPSTGWHKVENPDIPAELRPYLAEVNGQRSFYEGIPLNTHLCYSNPEVRQRMTKEVVRYAENHPNISALHIWLADNYNNICECEACQKHTQTDWYITLLNEIDDALTERGLQTKLVFLIYFELLWPPETVTLKNPSRFLMMFAPITRTYTRPLCLTDQAVLRENPPSLPPYRLNQMIFPSDTEENLSFLYHWQKEFTGDSFDYDYHLMWDIDKELGGLKLAKVLYEDCVRLKDIGLNGLISCQQNRAAFPSGLCQYIMARALFEPSCNFYDLVEEYAQAAYGEGSGLALKYLEFLSNGFSHAYMRGEEEGKTEADYAMLFARTSQQLSEIAPEIVKAAGKYQTRPWKVLEKSLPIYQHLASALKKKADGAPAEEMRLEAERLRTLVSAAESAIQKDLDAMYFNLLVGGFLEQAQEKIYQN